MDSKGPVRFIASFSFTCALLVYVSVSNALETYAGQVSIWLRSLADLVFSISIYLLLFEVMFQLYSRYFYQIFNRRLNLSGVWYQIFTINEYPNNRNAVRHGPCRIDATYPEIFISGENYKVDNTFSSSWQSEIVDINGDNLTLIFVSEGVRRTNSITRGTMQFHMSGIPPKKLTGNFADSTPATHSGAITLFRNKGEYEARLKAMISDDIGGTEKKKSKRSRR